MTTALEGGEGSASRSGRSLPPGKTRYPLYRKLVWPQGRSGQVRKISPPQGFDSRTVQPVASLYTDYATRPTHEIYFCLKVGEKRRSFNMHVYVNMWVSSWIRLGLKDLLEVVAKDKIRFILCQFENRPMGYNCKKSSRSTAPKVADERSIAWRRIASICIKMYLVIIQCSTPL